MTKPRKPASFRLEEIEMVEVSRESWDDAARLLVRRASRANRHVTGVNLIRSTAVVGDHKIEYHVTAKVAFVVEPAAIAR